MTTGKFSSHCHVIRFVDTVLTKDKSSLTVSASQRNEKMCADFTFVDVKASAQKEVHVCFSMIALVLLGVQKEQVHTSSKKEKLGRL